MARFAIMLHSLPSTSDGILMLVDDPTEAKEIAFELRRRGQEVDVREVGRPSG